MEEKKTCCFIGHRKVNKTEELKHKLIIIIENFIINKNIDTFLFGSKSEFNDLCLKVVTQLKEKYPHIKRVYVRAEFPHIDETYKKYLLESYEDTYYPENIVNAGKASYIERNYEMIDKSDICVIYYHKNYAPSKRKNSKYDLTDYQPKSGTKIAYNYALKKKKEIINLAEKEKQNDE